MKPALLALLVVLMSVATFTAPAVPQDPAFHVMADQRMLFGLPHALNVLSNVPFALVGIAGLILVSSGGRTAHLLFRDRWQRWPYVALFAGTTLVAVGSTYYHLSPDNARVVWDRLPITIGIVGLLTAVVAERVSLHAARRLFVPLLVLGTASVFSWYWTELAGRGDLRLYALVQFGSLLVVALILALYRRDTSGTRFLAAGLAAYGLAKAFEMADGAIFAAMGYSVSGHSLKHLAAAVGVACVLAMLRGRITTDVVTPEWSGACRNAPRTAP